MIHVPVRLLALISFEFDRERPPGNQLLLLDLVPGLSGSLLEVDGGREALEGLETIRGASTDEFRSCGGCAELLRPRGVGLNRFGWSFLGGCPDLAGEALLPLPRLCRGDTCVAMTVGTWASGLCGLCGLIGSAEKGTRLAVAGMDEFRAWEKGNDGGGGGGACSGSGGGVGAIFAGGHRVGREGEDTIDEGAPTGFRVTVS